MDLPSSSTPRILDYYRAYKEYDADLKGNVVFTNYPDERWLEYVALIILYKLEDSRGAYMLTQDYLAILRLEIQVHGLAGNFALHKISEGFRLTVNGAYAGTLKNISKNNGCRFPHHQPSLNTLRRGTTGRDDQCKAVFFDTSLPTSSVMYAYNKNHFKKIVEGPMDLSNSNAGTPRRQGSSPADPTMGIVSYPRLLGNYVILGPFCSAESSRK